MTAEATVIAVAVALYLLDCVVLLERGQAIWARGSLSFGSIHYQLRGKVLAFLNPLTPFTPVSRTLPLFSAGFGMDPAGVSRVLRPLALPAALQLGLVFVALPWCLLRAPGMPFLVALALAYLNALLMLALIARRFGRAGVARRPLAALGFGWLACLPLSVNCLRKAGLSFDIAMDAREAMRDLPPEEKIRAAAGLAAQIGEAMQELDEGDARHRALALLKAELETDHGRA